MSKLTVQAMDTAAAMDEIINKLGPDAVILSTSKINGKVVMEAASGALPSQPQPHDKNEFSRILSDKMLSTPNKNAEKIETATTLPNTKEIQNLQKQLFQLQGMLDGLFITNLDGINQDLSSNSRVTLQKAGFSPKVLDDFKTSYLGENFHNGCNRFLSDLSAHLTHHDAVSLLAKKFIFILGKSGTGRTTMAGKLTAYLKETYQQKDIITAEMATGGHRPNGQLQNFCRLLNSQAFTIGLDTSAADFNQIKSTEVMVVDIDLPVIQASKKLAEIITGVGKQNIGIILTVPASTSANMIEKTIGETKSLAPMVALTKLDECDLSAAEFSSFATVNAKIGLFSASRSIVDAPLFATEGVLMQYLSENFDYKFEPQASSKGLAV